tara:strand:+ start:1901 stop:2242 length:342 start_codon:yes stop_codon:yes gene_type:complete
MNEQPNIFDFIEAKHLKEKGMATAANSRNELLKVARDCAIWYAKHQGFGICTADDVAKVMTDRGYTYSDLGNAAGSIFKANDWNFTGSYVKSKKVSAHARDIKVWRLKEDPPC